METKKQYIAPELTVVSFRMEYGYANSNINPVDNYMLQIQQQIQQEVLVNDVYYNSQNQEIWYMDDDDYFDRW